MTKWTSKCHKSNITSYEFTKRVSFQFHSTLTFSLTLPLTKFDGLSVLPMGFVQKKKERKDGVGVGLWEGGRKGLNVFVCRR